jgi:hypothetical protein
VPYFSGRICNNVGSYFDRDREVIAYSCCHVTGLRCRHYDIGGDQDRSYGTPYVNHHKLAVFAYRRLFNPAQHALSKLSREHPPKVWLLEGFEGTSAEGSEQQLSAVVSVLDELVVAEKTAADRLQANARALEKTLASLCLELNYAIASRRLRKRCDLVPFF